MKTFKILHVEDDIDCNFLLTESLRRDKSAKVDWVSNSLSAQKALMSDSYDLVVCDGNIPGWDNHFEDVLKWAKNTPMCIYSAKSETEFGSVRLPDGREEDLRNLFLIFSKASEGTHNLVKYIKQCISNGDKA